MKVQIVQRTAGAPPPGLLRRRGVPTSKSVRIHSPRLKAPGTKEQSFEHALVSADARPSAPPIKWLTHRRRQVRRRRRRHPHGRLPVALRCAHSHAPTVVRGVDCVHPLSTGCYSPGIKRRHYRRARIVRRALDPCERIGSRTSGQFLNNSLPNTGDQQVLTRATGTENRPSPDTCIMLLTEELLVRIQPEEPNPQ